MTSDLYLALVVAGMSIVSAASVVFHTVKKYRDLAKNIYAAETTIIDTLKKKLPNDMSNWIANVITDELESALHSK